MEIWFLVPALAFLGLGVFFVYKALANRKRANLITHTPVAKVAELGPGPAKVQGRVVAFSEPLPAPLSGKLCVYFHFKVQEKRTTSHGPHGASSHWKTVINDVQNISFGLDDGTGIAGLDLNKAEVVLSPGTQLKSGFWKDAPPELERVLKDQYGRSSKGWIFNKTMRYTEKRIEEGDHLLVLGTVEATPGGNWQFVKGEGPYLISNKSQETLLSSYKSYTLLWSVLAVLVLIVPCLLVGLRLFAR
jgi:hypothetical protein